MKFKTYDKKEYLDLKIEDLSEIENIVVNLNFEEDKNVFKPFVSSLTKSKSSKELKFIFIDTEKISEIRKYDELEYSLYPVINNEYTAYRTLVWCIGEMNMRKRAIRYGYSKNIDDYNEINSESSFPHLVILINGTTKLLKGPYAKEIEIMFSRLSALGNELGIHMILFASDRDTTNGLIGNAN